jgi:hypothetical protein
MVQSSVCEVLENRRMGEGLPLVKAYIKLHVCVYPEAIYHSGNVKHALTVACPGFFFGGFSKFS